MTLWRPVGKVLERARALQLARDGGLELFVATVVAGLANFGFQMLMSRLLGRGTYGALGSLLGLVTMVAVMVGALQVAVTQAVAEHASGEAASDDDVSPASPARGAVGLALLRPLGKVAAFAGVGVLGVSAASPFLEGFLHLTSPIPVILLGCFVGLGVVSLVPEGVLLGRLRFRVVAVALLLGAVARLVAGVVLVAAGFGLDGAMAASVLNVLVTLAVFAWPLRHELRPGVVGDPLKVRIQSVVLAVIAVGGASAFFVMGPVLARHFLPRAASGYFVAATTAAQIALFLPGAVAMVAFPRFAVLRGSGPEARRLLVQALFLVGVLSGLVATVMLVFPRFVLAVLFGSRYEPASSTLGILAVAAAGAGMVILLVYFHLSRHSRVAALCWSGVVMTTVLITAFHSGLVPIALAVLVVTALLLVVLLVAAFSRGDEVLSLENATGELWELDEPECDLSIIVPYYNPGMRLRSTLEELVSVLEAGGTRFEVIAVSDGSTDGSEAVPASLDPKVIRSVRLASNTGKGEALRVGLSMGRGRYLGFIDADGDLSPRQVTAFVDLMASEEPDIVLGSKRHPMSEVDCSPLRRLYSIGYQQLVRVLFHLKVRDTQTGLKLIRRDVLVDVLPRMLEKRFAFDVELLVVARRLGYRRFLEAPVRLEERLGSTISVKAVWGMLLDTVAIFYRLRVLRWYEKGQQAARMGLDKSVVTSEIDTDVASVAGARVIQ